MSKVFKSFYTTVTDQRQIHTLPVVTIFATPEPSESVCQQAQSDSNEELANAIPAPEDLLQIAREEAAKILEDARQQAESMLTEAQKQVEVIMQKANQQVADLHEQARQSGFELGYTEAKQAAEAEFHAMMQQALSVIQQAELERKQYLLESEQQIIELASSIARKIINQELTVEHDWLVQTVQAALAEILERSRIEIYANPQEIPGIFAKKDELRAKLTPNVELQFVADPTIGLGGCVVQTEQGVIDAQIDTQLNEVKRALLEAAAGLTP